MGFFKDCQFNGAKKMYLKVILKVKFHNFDESYHKMTKLVYKRYFGAYMGFWDQRSSMALSQMNVKFIFKVKM